jgi:hypothetical protein
MPAAEPKSHHYVHRAYLEGFQDPDLERQGRSVVWAYMPDKNPFLQKPERVARRNYYYCYELENQRQFRAEHDLQRMEDMALPILDRVRHKSFSLNPDDRLTLAGYVALSHTRVPTFQRATDKLACLHSAKQMEHIANDPKARSWAIAKIFEETGEKIDPDDFYKKLTGGSVEITQGNRGWSLKQMFDTMLWLQELIFEMGWSFLVSPDGDPGFLTSDNPVSLFDPVGGLYGGVGFVSSPAAYFTFPLCRSVCLIAQHVRAPLTSAITSAEVRRVNKGTVVRADSQLYAPYKSSAVQRILDETIARRKAPTRILFSKGRVVEKLTNPS